MKKSFYRNMYLYSLYFILAFCIGIAEADDEDAMDCVGLDNPKLQIQWRLSYYDPKLLERGILDKDRKHIIKIRVRASIDKKINKKDEGYAIPMTLPNSTKISPPTAVIFKEDGSGYYHLVSMKNDSAGLSGNNIWYLEDHGSGLWSFRAHGFGESDYFTHRLECKSSVIIGQGGKEIKTNRLKISRKQLLLSAIYSKIEKNTFAITKSRIIEWIDYSGHKVYGIKKVEVSQGKPSIILVWEQRGQDKTCGATPLTPYTDILTQMDRDYTARAFSGGASENNNLPGNNSVEAVTLNEESLESKQCSEK